MIPMDDKTVIPVGEPSCPVSTGVRGQNRSLVPLDEPQNCAPDHDFHVHGIVLLVPLIIDMHSSIFKRFFLPRKTMC